MFRDFQEIEKNKYIINALLESVDWVTELRVSRNDVKLSSELFLKKLEKLINFWAITNGIRKSIHIKNRLHKRICDAKDPLNKEELANKVNNYHFVNRTHLIFIDKSLKKINKDINRDLKLVVESIRANKLSLGTSKT